MSDDLLKSLEWSCRDPVTHEPIDDGDYSNATVSEVKQAIAEITRLRAELATARREGVEDAAKIAWDYAIRLDDMAELSRYPHVKREHEGRSWVAQSIAAAIRASAKEGKP